MSNIRQTVFAYYYFLLFKQDDIQIHKSTGLINSYYCLFTKVNDGMISIFSNFIH